MIVLYDADCAFCRWAMAWALARDRRRQLVAVPIRSPLGDELLADLSGEERLRSAHVVGTDNRRRSGGAAAAAVLSDLPATRWLGALARSQPRLMAALYDALAARRDLLGRFVGPASRRRADQLLETRHATSAAALEARAAAHI